jgi:NUMOD4 motif/HNH endonuclease
MQEEFRDVVGYENLFMVSNLGNVFSKRSNRLLKQHKHTSGYFLMATRIGGKNGTNRCFRIHRIVAESFIPNPKNKPCINHKDGVKTNNCVTNLEWVTYSENSVHAIETGLTVFKKGEDCASSVLTNPLVLEIREIRKNYGYGGRKIAEILGVSKDCVDGVLYKRAWSHI